MKILFLILLFPLLSNATPISGEGTVSFLKGNVLVRVPGANKARLAIANEKLPDGTVIETAAGAVVRLRLSDGSTVNVGPLSKMEVHGTNAQSPAMLDLINGRIRANVQKDPAIGEKLIIKAGTAAMGIRGTDFVVDFNKGSGAVSLLTITGKVAMVRIEPGFDPAKALAGNPVLVGAGQSSSLPKEAAAPQAPRPIQKQFMEQLRQDGQVMPEFKQGGEIMMNGNEAGKAPPPPPPGSQPPPPPPGSAPPPAIGGAPGMGAPPPPGSQPIEGAVAGNKPPPPPPGSQPPPNAPMSAAAAPPPSGSVGTAAGAIPGANTPIGAAAPGGAPPSAGSNPNSPNSGAAGGSGSAAGPGTPGVPPPGGPNSGKPPPPPPPKPPQG